MSDQANECIACEEGTPHFHTFRDALGGFARVQERNEIVRAGIMEMRRIFGDYPLFAVSHHRAYGIAVALVIHLPASYPHDAEALLHRFDTDWLLHHCHEIPDVVFDYQIDG